MKRIAPLTRVLCIVGAAAGLTGCEPELTSVTITQLTEPPIDASATAEHVTLAEGTAIGIDVLGLDDEGATHDDIEMIETVSSPAFGWTKTATTARFIVYGSASGEGELRFTALFTSGTVVVPISVTAQ
jgi:hypothetical protein